MTETANAATNTTHLLWIGRWVEVVKHGDAWTFKNGRDVADWLLYPDARVGQEEADG